MKNKELLDIYSDYLIRGQHIQSCFLYAKDCVKRTRPKFCTLS